MANTIIKRAWNQNRMVNIEDLCGMAFQSESGGHTFNISGIDDTGAAVSLSGTVTAVFLRADNAAIRLNGSISNGKAVVTLSSDCYTVPGRFLLTIYVTSGGQKVAVYSAMGNVTRTDGVAAGSVPPLVTDRIQTESIQTGSIDASGDVTVNGVLDVTRRRCFFTVPSSSVGWYRVFNYNVTSETALAQMAGCVVKININVNRSQENHTIVLRPYSSSAPMFVEEFSSGGTANVKKIRYIKKTDNSGGFIDIYFANSGATQVGVAFDVYTSTLARQSQFAAINTAIEQRRVDDSPADETLLVEYTFSTNGTGDLNVNGTVTGQGFFDWLLGVGNTIPSNTNCNTLLTEGKYTCPSVAVANTLTNSPFAAAFGMIVFRVAVVQRLVQIAIPSSVNIVVKIRFYDGSTWTAWKTITPV